MVSGENHCSVDLVCPMEHIEGVVLVYSGDFRMKRIVKSLREVKVAFNHWVPARVRI